eukprot:scaffold5771_cov98-Isochrysis_galbana.AAC.2
MAPPKKKKDASQKENSHPSPVPLAAAPRPDTPETGRGLLHLDLGLIRRGIGWACNVLVQGSDEHGEHQGLQRPVRSRVCVQAAHGADGAACDRGARAMHKPGGLCAHQRERHQHQRASARSSVLRQRARATQEESQSPVHPGRHRGVGPVTQPPGSDRGSRRTAQAQDVEAGPQRNRHAGGARSPRGAGSERPLLRRDHGHRRRGLFDETGTAAHPVVTSAGTAGPHTPARRVKPVLSAPGVPRYTEKAGAAGESILGARPRPIPGVRAGLF